MLGEKTFRTYFVCTKDCKMTGKTRVLIVEDSSEKRNKIQEVVLSVDSNAVEVESASCVEDAVACLVRSTVDLLILDLMLPIKQGELVDPRGGERLLDAFRLDTGLQRPQCIVGLTSFPNLAKEYESSFSAQLWHLLEYSSGDIRWINKLKDKTWYLIRRASRLSSGVGTDVAILTALHDVELQQVLQLPYNWKYRGLSAASTDIHEGVIDVDGVQYSVVASAASEMGMVSAGICTTAICYEYQPRIVLMAGIIAGIQCNIGDVIVAESAIDYDSGKASRNQQGNSVFLPGHQLIKADASMVAHAKRFESESWPIESLLAGWGSSGYQVPSIRIGPVASGVRVIDDAEIRDRLRTNVNRKIIGIDMEIYGMYMAAGQMSAFSPKFLACKGVSDFGEKKTDESRKFAASMSARFCDLFLRKLMLRGGRSLRY